MAQLVIPIDLKWKDLQFYSLSMDFSNSGCGNHNFTFFATCVQLGAWALGQLLASFTDSLLGI
jgi:hypothetical protein